ncbi:MAG: hypothetical protein ACOVJ8_06530 [Sediminibacterium sp.]
MGNELIELSGVMYAPDFTKKQAEQTGIDLINKLFEEGNQTPVQFYSNIARLKAVIDSADKAFRERLNLTQADSYNGVTFTPKNGAESLNYAEDSIYADLENKLKQRSELLKVASKSDDLIFDSDGCEVPKVSKKFNKSSIVITF